MSDSPGFEKVREHREDLEALAESDLQSAKWARRLLEAVDEG